MAFVARNIYQQTDRENPAARSDAPLNPPQPMGATRCARKVFSSR